MRPNALLALALAISPLAACEEQSSEGKHSHEDLLRTMAEQQEALDEQVDINEAQTATNSALQDAVASLEGALSDLEADLIATQVEVADNAVGISDHATELVDHGERMDGLEDGLAAVDTTELAEAIEANASAIAALEALKRPCTVNLHTDSTYLRDGITKWIINWKRNGWHTAAKKPVKNVDLWQRLEEAIQRHEIAWHWVKGHAGDPGNEAADALARQGLDAYGRL